MTDITKKNEELSLFLKEPILADDPTIYLSANEYPYYLPKTKLPRRAFFFEEAQFRYEHTGSPRQSKKLTLKEKIQKHREARKKLLK